MGLIGRRVLRHGCRICPGTNAQTHSQRLCITGHVAYSLALWRYTCHGADTGRGQRNAAVAEDPAVAGQSRSRGGSRSRGPKPQSRVLITRSRDQSVVDNHVRLSVGGGQQEVDGPVILQPPGQPAVAAASTVCKNVFDRKYFDDFDRRTKPCKRHIAALKWFRTVMEDGSNRVGVQQRGRV